MSYPQAMQATVGLTGAVLGGAVLNQPPAPPETISQVLEQTQEKFGLIENQVDEIISRLFNFPRANQDNAKTPHVPATSERVMELRSRAMRINDALASVLDKL